MVGPGEEFNTAGKLLGFDEAHPGGTFVKIGVGVLRKPDDSKFDHSKTYEIVDGGKWEVKKTRDSVEFTQELSDPATGYGYLYKKTVRLMPGKPEMVLEHSLKNTGTKPIDSTVYDHNFWTLDNLAPGPGLVIRFPFQPNHSPAKERFRGDPGQRVRLHQSARRQGPRYLHLSRLPGYGRRL